VSPRILATLTEKQRAERGALIRRRHYLRQLERARDEEPDDLPDDNEQQDEMSYPRPLFGKRSW
jgi:hypothetical protein